MVSYLHPRDVARHSRLIRRQKRQYAIIVAVVDIYILDFLINIGKGTEAAHRLVAIADS